MELYLPARPPFSFQAVADSHGWRQLAPFQGDVTGLSYILRLTSGRVTELLFSDATTGVHVAGGGHFTPAEEAEVAAVVGWIFGLELDLSAFYAAVSAEPKLAQVAQRGQGRILRGATLFEDVVKTILTTNTTWGSTRRMTANLVARFGEPLPADPDRHAFPTPAQIASADAEMLRQTVRLGYRAPYLLELARNIDSGALDLEALKLSDLPTSELRKRLRAVKGVGPYAVANLLMLLGRYDAIPIDSWALHQVSQEWHGGAAIGPAEVEAAFARWGQWKGLAYWFWQWTT